MKSNMTCTEMQSKTENNFMSTSPSNNYIKPFSDSWVIASTFFIIVFFIFGVTANAITIAVIQQSSRLKSRYYAILTSMCVSDIISAFISIIFLYRRTWGFLNFGWPEFFCRLYWGTDLWTSFATALHILSFAVLRFIGVKWPPTFRRISSGVMKTWIISIWLFTFFGGFIPHFIFNTVNNITREENSARARWASCSLSCDWFKTWQVYVQIAYAVYIYLPAVGIIGISTAITVMLRRRRAFPGDKLTSTVSTTMDHSSPNISAFVRNQSRKRPTETPAERRWRKNKQAIFQLLLIVGSFLFGYIPFTAFHFYTGFTLQMSDNYINKVDWRFGMIQYLMLRFSECLNPIFYNAASQKMRVETAKMLRKTFACIVSKTRAVSETFSRYSKGDTSEI